MTIKFVSLDQNINYSIICLKTDNFLQIEKILYDKFPEYINENNEFILNGNKIIKNKNIEENKINDNDIIILAYPKSS